jgi:hypothetical protein
MNVLIYILETILFQIVFPFVNNDVGTRLRSMGTAGDLAGHVSFPILLDNHTILGHLLLNQNHLKDSKKFRETKQSISKMF